MTAPSTKFDNSSLIDEVQVYARALSPAEVEAQFQAGAAGTCKDDCNGNGVFDRTDIANGTSQDVDGNGVPDECEPCADLDGDGDVDLADLSILLARFGTTCDG